MLETEKSVLYLSFSNQKLGNYPALILAVLEVKSAAARANLLAGMHSPETFTHIKKAIKTLKIELSSNLNPDSQSTHRSFSSDKLRELYPVDTLAGGGSISIHMNISERIAALSGLSLDSVNASQSTADVCHTAFRMAIYRETQPLLTVISALTDTLTEQAKAWDDTLTLSRTCLQDALPISLGRSWGATASALIRGTQRLIAEMNSLLSVNLGGTVVGSSSGASPVYRDHIIEELRLASDLPLKLKTDLYDAAQYSDDLSRFHSNLSQIVQVLMKFSRDLRTLSSGPQGGMGELTLPRVQKGSAFFPLKTNPVLPETLLQCGFKILGGDHMIQVALQHAELNLNVFEGSIVITILDSIQFLKSCLWNFHNYCVRDIKPNLLRCNELAQLGYLKPEGEIEVLNGK